MFRPHPSSGVYYGPTSGAISGAELAELIRNPAPPACKFFIY